MSVQIYNSAAFGGSQTDWLPALAQSQGFLLDALEANRAGRYTEAQVQILELRGRFLLNRKTRGAWGALGCSLIGRSNIISVHA
jgi:hypothetical protein